MKTTQTFYVAELQNLNSYREATQITATTLTAAKRIASKMQSFYDTVIVVGNSIDNNGFISNVECYKENGKNWASA